MDPLQTILVLTGVLVVAAGVVLLVRDLRGVDERGARPYVPFATIAIGIAIAYRSYADYRLLDQQDIAIMLVFVVGLAMLLGLQFWIVDRHKPRLDATAAEADARNERVEEKREVASDE